MRQTETTKQDNLRIELEFMIMICVALASNHAITDNLTKLCRDVVDLFNTFYFPMVFFHEFCDDFS